ncbi:glucose-1-phosphate adenylyltransferase [Paenibacillus sediminis]|uniref:Glucose-1-phosphate adenylyltransferase n=1 Tax=Paenibacillus sediminis TaxID=664909 RepID=A0ABS4H1G2_9BACL|nr:glucose-1-phosphate adenylyltransferase [Paenibacillus sediminis]MBP1935950.1 glucose-1-phosphate adenylyltransferase [Paenibacillus sediminis]
MNNQECIAMLLAGGEGRRLAPLTSNLAKPAVPFGGQYRIIDFPLSNCTNSGIQTVGVLTQYEAESLHEHIGEGEPWRLSRSGINGITLLPSYLNGPNPYSGTADAIYQNIEFIDQHSPEHVLVLSGDHIYHMDYRQMLHFHKQNNASATISVIPVSWEEAHRFGVMNADENFRITEFEEKPATPRSNLASMGIYLFKWSYLKEHLLVDAEDVQSSHDFGKDVIPRMLSGEEPLYAYSFKGYWRDVGTVESLWQAHMDLLSEMYELELYKREWPMYTRDWSCNWSPSKTRNMSVIHDSSMMEGSAERSVVFCGAEVGKGTKLIDSIIMPNAKIGRNAYIEHAIIGEGAVVKEGAVIKGQPGDIIVIGSNQTVQAKPVVRTQPPRILKEVYEKTGRLRAEGLPS